MNFLWEAWLGVFTDTLDEAIINRRQGKTVEHYETLMTASRLGLPGRAKKSTKGCAGTAATCRYVEYGTQER